MTQPTPEYCRELLRCIPQRPDREIWLYCISAIGNTYPENVALSLLLERFTDELPNQHAYTLRHRLNSVNFGTLVWYARKYGYKGKYDGIEHEPPTPHITPEPEPISFADADAKTLIVNADGERVFRLAVNRKVVNKDKFHDAKTHGDALTHGFTNEELTLSQIADEIRQGHALCAAQMVQKADGSIHRLSANFLQSEMIFLDFDYSKGKEIDLDTYIPIELFLEQPFAEAFAIIHTTFSSTPEHNRYRGLLPLPYVEKNPERYQKVLKTFIAEYKADEACKDICRPFFGNTNATIYNLTTGEIHQ